MSKPKVLVARMTPGLQESRLFQECDVWAWREDRPIPRPTLLEQVREAEGLFTSHMDQVNPELLAVAGKLKVVSNYAVGLDNLDLKALTARRIPAGHLPTEVTDATADMALTLILALSRRIVPACEYVKSKQWKEWTPTLQIANDVHGKTLGILGLGRIGQGIARRAKGFNMGLLYYDPVRKPEAEQALGVQFRTMDALLGEADIIVCSLPLMPETRYLINDAAFAKMKPTALFLNMARGPITDGKALYRALSGKRIAGAALDVTDPEPLPLDDPLLTLDNLFITPHIATSTWETRRKMTEGAVTNLLLGLAGKPLLHCANPEAQG